ncbi:hypothetical protein EXA23_07965 [Vibrio cincinnatiensis]|nr:hypothetical protein [Vibrio cincinnatiensis]MCG3725868.1 hypothetical protein [Vibrio cincinnatiensis]MCG3732875.1 hypothetical protein [Vibrio cincinnatiensis]MCG3736865.1 hypothetical protein [Vibrio cincinnatiensis]MCG3740386.1 hypothetical protein [Vibrio cincinnatiensis]
MSIANQPEKIYISPRNASLNGLILKRINRLCCCDVVFANSEFELGSFYHPILCSYPLLQNILPVFIFDLSVKYLAPPIGGVFLWMKENSLKGT